jgi:hypothetical protein
MNPSTETSGITRRSLAETYEAQDLIIQAAQDAKREATKAYREQLDRVGMDKDAIKSEVEGFKLAYRRKVAVEKKGSDEVEHRDAIADEIYLEITSPAPRATRVATTVPDGFDPETGEEITEPQEAQAPAQAVPGDAPVASVPVESIAAEISTPITHSQSAPQAESDLTDPKPLGQVATNPEAKASEDGGATVQHIGLADDSVTGDASRASDGAGTVAPIPFTPKPLRPYCQNPGNTCGGMGRKHCFKCQKAHDEQQGAA